VIRSSAESAVPNVTTPQRDHGLSVGHLLTLTKEKPMNDDMTHYTLEHNVTEDALQEVRNCFDLFDIGFIFDNGVASLFSWYEHEGEMRYVSQHFPEFTFTLTGIGESNGEMWKKRFQAGQVEEARAEIVWPEFKRLLI